MRPFPRSNNSENRLSIGSLVEYQQHGNTNLGILVGEKRNKFVVRNSQGATLELGAERLVLLSKSPPINSESTDEITKYLVDLSTAIYSRLDSIDLSEVWELLLDEGKPVTIERIQELLFSNPSIEDTAALRRLMLSEQVYFKRQKKNDLFEPRNKELVEELLHQKRVEEEKERKRSIWIDQAIKRINNPNEELPTPIEPIEQLAALGKSASNAKESQILVDTVVEKTTIQTAKSIQQRAFNLLVALHHFTPHELLTPYRLQRPTNFTEKEISEANIPSKIDSSTHPPCSIENIVTIDGPETKDFDDAISLQNSDNGNKIVGIHISDASSVVTKDSTLYQTAIRRGTSIYCPDKYFPMFPRELCENSLSLKQDQIRPVLSFYLEIDKELNIVDSRLVLETIKVKKRLTYDEVDKVLCDGDIGDLQEFEELLTFCWELASRSEITRLENGAAQFIRRELSPSITDDFNVTAQPSDEDTPARKLISELMIMCNQCAATFASNNQLALFFRAQESPEVDYTTQGDHIPEGPAREFFQRSFFKRSTVQSHGQPHFGLGVPLYTQVTSPIRRVIDLINQQQITNFLIKGSPLYTAEEIDRLQEEIQKGLDEAFLIQRESNRYWLLQYIVQEKIRTVKAIVMRVDGPKPLAEIEPTYSIFSFHAAKNSSPQLGEIITLEIQSINPKKDSIVLKQAN